MARTKTREKSTPQIIERLEHEPGETLTETRHLACPTCGLMARLVRDPLRRDKHGKVLPSIEGGPYPTYARMQTYGGKGYIYWDSPEPLSDEERALLTDRMTLALSRLQAGTLLEVPELREVEPSVEAPEVRRPAPVRIPAVIRPPSVGPSKIQAYIEQARTFGARAREIKADPNLVSLHNLEQEIGMLSGQVEEIMEQARGDELQQATELQEELERALYLFEPAEAALTKRPINFQQWNIAMNQLATCCGYKLAPEEEEPEPPAAAAPVPKTPRKPKTPPAPIKVTWRYADVPGGPVTEHDQPPPSKSETKSPPAETKQPKPETKPADPKLAAVLAAHAKLKAMEKPNLRSANLAIEKLQEQDIDVSEAEDALSDYGGLERSDYDSAEEYRDARQEAWDEFLDKLEEEARPEDE